MYSSLYFSNLQKTLNSLTGSVLDLRFVSVVKPEKDLIEFVEVTDNGKVIVVVNSKCREFAINSLYTKNSGQVLLHLYDMCRSKEASLLMLKVKNTLAVCNNDDLDFNHVINKVAPRCWAWVPEEQTPVLTDLDAIKHLNKNVSHVCLEGHSKWTSYKELI